MRDYDFIGIDVAKEKFDACLLQGVDTRLEQIFDNTAVGIKKFVVWVQQHTAHAWVGMEATGHYSEIIAESLIAYGLEVSIINPMQIK